VAVFGIQPVAAVDGHREDRHLGIDGEMEPPLFEPLEVAVRGPSALGEHENSPILPDCLCRAGHLCARLTRVGTVYGDEAQSNRGSPEERDLGELLLDNEVHGVGQGEGDRGPVEVTAVVRDDDVGSRPRNVVEAVDPVPNSGGQQEETREGPDRVISDPAPPQQREHDRRRRHHQGVEQDCQQLNEPKESHEDTLPTSLETDQCAGRLPAFRRFNSSIARSNSATRT